ncbi:MAG: SulP family inorganic anion transporter, partial [Pseudomonadota bacterium]
MRQTTHSTRKGGLADTLLHLVLGAGTGITVGLAAAVTATSMAAIAYSGEIETFASAGAMITLMGAAVVAMIGALTLSYRGTVCGPQDVTAVTLSVAAAGVVANAPALAGETLFATVVVMLSLATALTGALFVVLGGFRLGNFARYVPYPVVGGFLAATGLLLVLAAIAISTGRTVTVFTLPDVLMGSEAIRWVPSIALAALFFMVSLRSEQQTVLAGVLALSFVGFYAALILTGTSLEEARAMGLLLGARSGPEAVSSDTISPLMLLGSADYGAILGQAPTLIAVCALAAVGLVMSANGLEHTTRSEVRVNRDFLGMGIGNLTASLLGGLPSYQYFGATTLAHKLHLRSAAAGISAGLVCLSLVLAGRALFENLPVCVLAGLSGFIGLNLIHDWLWVKRRTLPALDYAVVWLIVAVMAGVGFLEGVATGLAACVAIFVVLSTRQDVVLKSFTSATRQSMVDRGAKARASLERIGDRNQIFELNGHLFFGTANRLYEEVCASMAHGEIECIVLDFRRVQSIDSSAVHSFEKIVTRCAHHEIRLVVTGLPEGLRQASGLKAAIENGSATAFGEVDEG